MPRFLDLLGKHVEVLYRARDVNLPASGILVADTGDCLLLEKRYVEDGREKTLRWGIPYASIMRVIEPPKAAAASSAKS